jgi:hypothetical protein
MSTNEETYKSLVDEHGYALATRTVELVVSATDHSGRSLFFAALINAYYRGKASGISDCREIVVNRKRPTETTHDPRSN